MFHKENPPRPPMVFDGIEILRLSRPESFQFVLETSKTSPVRVGWIYANSINVLRQDSSYRPAIEPFEFLLNDGAGIEIAGKVLGTPVISNLCGTDWIPELLDRLNQDEPGTRLFLLGATQANNERAAINAAKRWPAITVAGHHSGYFDDVQTVLDEISKAQPDVLVVGLGVPMQERFLTEHWLELTKAGVKIAAAGGAIVDHFAGVITRAPKWMQRIRMEWFYRLVTEPRRLWHRYIIGNTTFFWALFKEWLRK